MKGLIINGLNKTQRTNRKTANKFGGRNWWKKRKKIVPILLNSQNGLCNICKKSMIKEEITVDHIIPYSEGGSKHLNNFQLLCVKCHTDKDRENNRKFGQIGKDLLVNKLSK